MKVYFVSGVDTNVGKTFVSHHLVLSLQKRGIRALAIKPIETGVEGIPPDASLHLQDAQKIDATLTLKDINTYCFSLPAAPMVADVHNSIQIDLIFEQIKSFEQRVEILFVEGAGGLFVPIQKDYFMTSFAQDLRTRFDAQVLMVCDDRLGMINRFLGAKFILDSLKLQSLFFVNIQDKQTFKQINYPLIKDYDFEMEIEDLAERILKG